MSANGIPIEQFLVTIGDLEMARRLAERQLLDARRQIAELQERLAALQPPDEAAPGTEH